MLRISTHAVAGAALLGLLALTADARACGGTFCDRGPVGSQPMPVDQSGENIVFFVANGRVEAHIQIQYTGDPKRFAWLVPVPKIPDVTVGSNQLFLNLLNGTVPTFSVTNTYHFCGGGSVSTPSGGCGMSAASNDSSAAFNGTGSEPPTTDTNSDIAVGHEAVGAFDVTTLQPKDPAEITAWLDQNGFLFGSDAVPLFQDYINRGHVFVAVKLQPDAGVNEIHPLVVSYDGTEPCIPIVLTSVAATEDMGIRAFFLGDRRTVPVNYVDVELNPERFDWVNLASNYTSVVARAVDEAGTHAFVTEYAGPSKVVSIQGIWDPRWDSAVFGTTAASDAMRVLGEQGLVNCASGPCAASNPLVLPIVRQYLPAPSGVSEQAFYSCLAEGPSSRCTDFQADPAAWDGTAFAKDLEERVILPAKHAFDLLSNSPYTTRLFTTLSPAEMTEDPTFAPASLAASPVPAQLSATIDTFCSGDQAVQIPGRKDAALDSGGTPKFAASMPFAARVTKHDATGGESLISDKGSVIDSQIQSWNESQGFPHPDPVSRSASSDSSSSRSSSNGEGCMCALGTNSAHSGHAVALFFAASVLRRAFKRTKRVQN